VKSIKEHSRYAVNQAYNTKKDDDSGLWLSGSVYRAKSCTSVFLTGKFLFVRSSTFAVGCIV